MARGRIAEEMERMHAYSSAACAGRHIRPWHSCVSTLSAGTCPPQECPFPWWIWTPSGTWYPRESTLPNVISIGSVCTAHPYAQHTDTQTTLRATSVAICRIYALRADDAAYNNNKLVDSAFYFPWDGKMSTSQRAVLTTIESQLRKSYSDSLTPCSTTY